jgi:hypothetical protein
MSGRHISSRLEALDRRIGPGAQQDDQARLHRARERAAAEMGMTVDEVIVEASAFMHMTIDDILALPAMAGVSRQQLIDEANRLLAKDEVFDASH